MLPSAEDHDDGSEYESAQEDVEENEEDPFEDFPDDVDVRTSPSLPAGSLAIANMWNIGSRTRACACELTRTTATAALLGSSETAVPPTERCVFS